MHSLESLHSSKSEILVSKMGKKGQVESQNDLDTGENCQLVPDSSTNQCTGRGARIALSLKI